MKEKYYYLRDKERKPLITVCLLYVSGHIARGVAICSPSDNPEKREGRRIAFKKAEKAFLEKTQTEPVIREEPIEVINRVTNPYGPHRFSPYLDMLSYKSVFNPILIDHEKRMLGVL